MALIPLSEYRKKHNKYRTTVSQMAKRGSFQTAQMIGTEWFIDENEPYPDKRIKSGKYIKKDKKQSIPKNDENTND